MNGNSCHSWIITSLFLLSPLQVCYAGTSNTGPTSVVEWKDRFLKEAPKGWAKYSARASQLQGQISGKGVFSTPNKRLVYESTWEIKQAPGCALAIQQKAFSGDKEDLRGELTAVNPRYGFELKRKSPAAPWVLFRLNKEPITEPPPDYPDTSALGIVRSTTDGPIFAYGYGPGTDWPALLSNPAFQLKQVVPIEEEGRTLLQVDFEVNWSASREHLRRLKSGRVFFEPERSWVVRKCDLKVEAWVKDKSYLRSITRSFDYVNDGGDFPILKSGVQREKSVDENFEDESQSDYALVLGEAPQSDFTLSAFGLPDPVGLETKKPTRWYLWLGGAAIVCLVLGVGALKLRRRATPHA